MPVSDYTGAVGGALKFKGGSKITKPGKKRRLKTNEAESSSTALPANTSSNSNEINDDEEANCAAATPEKPPTTRRTSSQNDTEGLLRRRTTLDSSPATATDTPPRERITSPDPQHAEREWHSIGAARTTSTREEGASGGERTLAGALRDAGWRAKTEAERRHDERRRRRIEERVRREGVKTHKERVEEFNARLSGLSEHHDMPRIGPG